MSPGHRYRAVLFDLDGTLVDSYAALASAVNYARSVHGLTDLSTDEIRGLVGHGVERLLQRAFGRDDIPRTAVEAFESHYDTVCCRESRILDGVAATLAHLAERGVPMAVCTNKPTVFSRKILEALNLSGHFRGIIGPDLAGARKPDPRHIQATLRTIGSLTSGALFVGDMPIDVEAARNGGLDVAVIATGSSSREQLEDAGPDFILQRFGDLVSLVCSESSPDHLRWNEDPVRPLRAGRSR